MRTLTIAGATLNQTPINWEGNKGNILLAIEEAKERKVDILCFPELCITGYGCEDLFLSEWIHKRAFTELLKILPYCNGIAVSIGLPVLLNEKAYNCSAMIENGKILGIYAKQNLANDGVHYEQRWFTPWIKETQSSVAINGVDYDIGDLIYNIKGVKIGFEICEDAWIEDRPGCRLHEKGVELIINPSASHFAFGKDLKREKLIVDSSEKFGCAYLYTNLLGNEAGRMIYDGEILIAQQGKLITKNEHLSFLPFQIISATIDFDIDNVTTEGSFSAISKNESFEKASALALYDYLRKSKSNGFVLSLSGGADSACCAVLVASMVKYGIQTFGVEIFLKNIGQEKLIQQLPKIDPSKFVISRLLTCVYQSSANSGAISQNAAKSLADSIGATFYQWSIQEEVESYSSKISTAIGRELSWDRDDIVLQNIQARSRSPIIWMLANINNALLLTTSNRSEGDVGYTTMDGDTSGSIAPIAAIDKPFIRQWLMWAEVSLGYNGLHGVNTQVPTAELRPSGEHQTDEDDLMPYDIMVAIERLAIGQHKSPIEVYEILSNDYSAFNPISSASSERDSETSTQDSLQVTLSDLKALKNHIAKFYKLWSINQWKRERLAPSFHLDDFNVDPKTWCRFPILSGSYKEEIGKMMDL